MLAQSSMSECRIACGGLVVRLLSSHCSAHAVADPKWDMPRVCRDVLHEVLAHLRRQDQFCRCRREDPHQVSFVFCAGLATLDLESSRTALHVAAQHNDVCSSVLRVLADCKGAWRYEKCSAWLRGGWHLPPHRMGRRCRGLKVPSEAESSSLSLQVNICDNKRRTPIHLAAAGGNYQARGLGQRWDHGRSERIESCSADGRPACCFWRWART